MLVGEFAAHSDNESTYLVHIYVSVFTLSASRVHRHFVYYMNRTKAAVNDTGK